MPLHISQASCALVSISCFAGFPVSGALAILGTVKISLHAGHICVCMLTSTQGQHALPGNDCNYQLRTSNRRCRDSMTCLMGSRTLSRSACDDALQR